MTGDPLPSEGCLRNTETTPHPASLALSLPTVTHQAVVLLLEMRVQVRPTSFEVT